MAERRICIEEGCKTHAIYNYAGNNKRLYCSLHKKANMINVMNRRCLEQNCNVIPCYNLIGEKRGIYCFSHKKDNMVNVKDKICLEEGCKIKPCYNFPGKKVGKYCVAHRKENMVNVILDKCLEEGCNTTPTYNYTGNKKALYCKTHKKDGMIDIKHKMCIETDCNTRASYNNSNTTMPIYCTKHKKDGMIILHTTICKTPLCGINVLDKYDGYCFRCYVINNPGKPNSRNYKTKENIIKNYILEEFPNITIITDKTISDGCSNRRPDILIDLGYQIIIVEIDENQHKQYDCTCENKRLMELSQDVSHRNIVFIRFNPDDYVDKTGNKIKSSWKIDGKGLCVLNKDKIKEWEYRLLQLKNNIQYWLDNKTDKMIEIIQLYYDQN